MVTEPLCENEEEELHKLQHLVAGANQEWELVQQPKHAAMCMIMDWAHVWNGRGYCM